MFGALGRRAGGLGVLPGGAGGLVPLILPGWLHPATNFARASAAALLRSADPVLIEVAADVPRFDPELGLLLEGQATNLVSAARTVGSTGWSNTGITAAPAMGPDGLAAGAFTLTEDLANTQHISVFPTVSYAAGQPFTLSILVLAESCSTVQLAYPVGAFGAAAWANFNLQTGLPGTVGATATARMRQCGAWWLIQMTATPSSSGTTTFAISLTLTDTAARLPVYVGQGRSLRVAYAQVEQRGFATSPILHPVGVPGVTTRLMDAPTWAASALGIPASGACTVSGVVNIPTISANHTIWQMDDGTNANRVMLRIEAGGALRLWRVLAGVTSFAALGTATDEVPLRWAVSVAGDGTASAAVNGGAEVTVTGGPTAGMTVLRGGHAVGTESLQGYLTRLAYSPRPIPAADLPGLSRRGVADLVSMREIIQWP
jgi:hypothetical protein